ncbi:MAG: 23S rRNA (guanosine(2251)-2'-O)-methyltransferase RlmB, partial [Leucobacter sp.]|nr:23S rRNA (guanosine(2251)-2'-O)-methyltransferase RlmB [Leucobacter sp.]
MSNKKGRTGAVRKKGLGKGVGSGGQGRQALEGRGPTPRAEDREYHPAAKAKAARERYEAAKARHQGGAGGGGGRGPSTRKTDESELVTGRNAVLEALRTKIPATTLYIAARIEMDDRMREIMRIAT